MPLTYQTLLQAVEGETHGPERAIALNAIAPLAGKEFTADALRARIDDIYERQGNEIGKNTVTARGLASALAQMEAYVAQLSPPLLSLQTGNAGLSSFTPSANSAKGIFARTGIPQTKRAHQGIANGVALFACPAGSIPVKQLNETYRSHTQREFLKKVERALLQATKNNLGAWVSATVDGLEIIGGVYSSGMDVRGEGYVTHNKNFLYFEGESCRKILVPHLQSLLKITVAAMKPTSNDQPSHKQIASRSMSDMLGSGLNTGEAPNELRKRIVAAYDSAPGDPGTFKQLPDVAGQPLYVRVFRDKRDAPKIRVAEESFHELRNARHTIKLLLKAQSQEKDGEQEIGGR